MGIFPISRKNSLKSSSYGFYYGFKGLTRFGKANSRSFKLTRLLNDQSLSPDRAINYIPKLNDINPFGELSQIDIKSGIGWLLNIIKNLTEHIYDLNGIG